MTSNLTPAPVLHTPGAIPIPAWYVAPSIAINGDEAIRTKRRTPGTLWERTARATLNSAALTPSQWARMASKRSELGTRSRRPFVAGSRVIDWPGNSFASGTIRAGRML